MVKKCESCPKRFESRSPKARFCSDKCRKRASRSRTPDGSDSDGEASVIVAPAGVLVATLRELERAGRADTPLGQIALALAARLQFATADTGSALASVSKELRATLAAATEGAERAADPVDELRRKREERQRKRGA